MAILRCPPLAEKFSTHLGGGQETIWNFKSPLNLKYYLLNSFTHLMRFSYGSFILIVRINSQVKRDPQPLSQGKRMTGARRSFYTENMSSRGFWVTYFSPRQGRGKLFFNICTYFARNLYSMGSDCNAGIVYLKTASWDRDAVQELLLA